MGAAGCATSNKTENFARCDKIKIYVLYATASKMTIQVNNVIVFRGPVSVRDRSLGISETLSVCKERIMRIDVSDSYRNFSKEITLERDSGSLYLMMGRFPQLVVGSKGTVLD